MSLKFVTTYPTLNKVPFCDWILFATDHIYVNSKEPNKVSKRFFRMGHYDFYERLLITPPQHRTFYEYVDSTNRKIHANIECEFDDKDRDAVGPLFDTIISSVCISIRTELSSKNVDYRPERDCIILSSHGLNKLSVHIIINNFYSLENL